MIEGNGGWLRVEFKDRDGGLVDVDAGAEVTITVFSPARRVLATLTGADVVRVAKGTYEAPYTAPSGFAYFEYQGASMVGGVPQVNRAVEPIVRSAA